MKPFSAILALCALLTGCAYEGPAGSGAAVRAIMASQIVPPQPRTGPEAADGVAAAAAYANYRQSYVAPTPQGDSTMVGHR